MNQRREPRIQVDQSVAITIFGEPDLMLWARIKNLSGWGIGLSLQGPVAAGTALKIELEDAMLLGEVIYCRQDGDSFYVGVALEQALNGLAELSRAVAVFAEQAKPASPAMAGALRSQGVQPVPEGAHQSQQ